MLESHVEIFDRWPFATRFDLSPPATTLEILSTAEILTQSSWMNYFDPSENWLPSPFSFLRGFLDMDGSSLLSAPNPIIFLDLAIGRTKSFLESTAEFWGLRTGEPMTREQAREAAANVVGFIKTLARWEKAERVQLVLQGRHKPRQKEHDWAFRGLLSCGHCGCAMTAERKKGKYTYYRCTGHRGKCPEKFAREEEVARQFAEALDGIRLDHEVA